jgi:hypothetical protein
MRSKAGAEGVGSAGLGGKPEVIVDRRWSERPGEERAGMSKLPVGDWGKALKDGDTGPGGRATRPTPGEETVADDLLRGGGGRTISGASKLMTSPAPCGDVEDDVARLGESVMLMRGEKWTGGIFFLVAVALGPLRRELRPTEGEAVV